MGKFLDNLFTFLVLGGISLVMFAVGALMVLGAVVVLGSALWNVGLALVSRLWQTTTGEIVSARRSREGEEEVQATYRYTVDGQTYTGSRLAFGTPRRLGGRRRGRRGLGEWQPGASVPVYFDPNRPSWATLDRAWPRGLLGSCLGGLALLVFGVVLGGAGGCGLAELLFGVENC